jgi:hypothetical protein
MKLARLSLLGLTLLFATATVGLAQTTADVFTGVGFVTNSSNGQSQDPFGTGTYYATPSLNSAMMMFGGTAMLNDHFGINGEVLFRPNKGDYAGLQYRPVLFDFNGVYLPFAKAKRFVPEFQAGIGAINLRYYYSETSSNAYTGTSTYSSYLGNAKHFQTHLGAGLKIYVKDNLYIKPQVDLHYVANFTQFGSNMTPRYGVAVGYTFGR